jgi:Ca2+-binding EF-hand superfamily protein
MPYTDDQIRAAVISLFKKYDKDNSGYVESAEINSMCNDLAKELGSKQHYSPNQINSILSTLDRNQDGRVTKDELYVLMRKLNP